MLFWKDGTPARAFNEDAPYKTMSDIFKRFKVMLKEETERAMKGKGIQRSRKRWQFSKNTEQRGHLHHYQDILGKRQGVTLNDRNHSSVQTATFPYSKTVLSILLQILVTLSRIDGVSLVIRMSILKCVSL